MSSIGLDTRFDALLTLFIQDAEDAARRTGCVQRLRCFSGATLVRTLVFGFLHHPRATLTNLVTMAAVVGVTISPQGLAKRFTPAGVQSGLTGALGGLSDAIREFGAEIRLGMAEREHLLRTDLGLDGTHDVVDAGL